MKRSTALSRIILSISFFLIYGQFNGVMAGGLTNNPSMNRILNKVQQNGTARVIVKLKSTGSPVGFAALSSVMESKKRRLLKVMKAVNASDIKQFDHFPLATMEIDTKGLTTLLNNPDIEGIYEDALFEPALIDSTSLIGSTITASAGHGGTGQVIAILDTGVDRNHPFLANKVIDEACFSKTTSSSTSLCPNGNNSQTGIGSAQPCSGYCGHGTHVAGIAAGKGSDFSGVAPEAKIMAIQIFSLFSGSSCGSSTATCALAYTSDILSGLEYVYSKRSQYNIASVNLSLGGGAYSGTCDSDLLKNQIDLLKSAGIATVVASGNNGYSSRMNSPACISSAISVGATTKSDLIASFSNSSPYLDLLAPGYSIRSSVVGSGYGYMSGTSMATPHVAGAFAVLRSIFPTKTVDELLTLLKTTGTPITDSRNSLTFSRIDVNAAAQTFTPHDVENDFNPDGKADIFWRNTVTGENRVYFMNGPTILDNQPLGTTANTNWIVAGVGDFNGDKGADIFWRNQITGMNRIDIMSGTSLVSSTEMSLHSSIDWEVSGVGDFNADGKDDILWMNNSTGEVRMTLLNGSSVISDNQISIVGLDWKIQDTGDFDGDGKDDILWRNTNNGRVWMYLLDGSTILSSAHVAYTDLSWNISGIGDLDGDGKDDIIWRNKNHGRVWTYLMNGLNIANGTPESPGEHIAFTSLDWEIKTISDFDGDGRDDILWRNVSSGENWMFLMNGPAITTNKSAGMVSDLNWKIEKGK